MRSRFSEWQSRVLSLIFASLLSACGGNGETTAQGTLASASDVSVIDAQPGVTPFISFLRLEGKSLGKLTTVRYTIAPKPGTASKPVDVTYTIEALTRRGYFATNAPLTLPAFGLYSGYRNQLNIELRFQDGTAQTLSADVLTAGYSDPQGIYDRPTILTQRATTSELGFDFFAVKPNLGSPVVLDTDGEIRWAVPRSTNSVSSAFESNSFLVGDTAANRFSRIELDGTVTQGNLISPTFTNFHHNIDPGKLGLLIEVDTAIGGVVNLETTAAEITTGGAVIKEWDFASILRTYMLEQGDDPGTFVRPGVDWFHMNSATYDARDNSLVVSSRENFVVKVDYRTGRLIWILGDPTKYWYTFPSLRAKALTLQAGDLYPIGQHATSITSDGLLMLFNNGTRSFNQPAGAPAGENRTYSAVSAYSIDAVSLAAREVWRFDHGQSILSDFCSSAYEAPGKSLLVNFADASSGTLGHFVGLDASRKIVFEFRYASPAGRCGVGWNAIPVPFESLRFE